MLKRKGLIILSVFILVIFAVSTTVAFSSSKMHQLGQIMKNLKGASNEEIATTNDANFGNITEKEFKLKKSFLKIQDKNISNEKVFDLLLKNKALVAEAKNRGLYPSDSEVDEYISNIRRTVENAEANGMIDKESQDGHNEYLSGLGMTQEQYFKDEDNINAYAQGYALGKLRVALIKEWGFNMNDPKEVDKFEKKLDDFALSLVSKININMKKDLSAIQ